MLQMRMDDADAILAARWSLLVSVLCVCVCRVVCAFERAQSISRRPTMGGRGRLYVANIGRADVPALERLFDKYGRIIDMSLDTHTMDGQTG